MRLRITIAMLEIRNRETLQSKVNICKSDVKIGDYADSLSKTMNHNCGKLHWQCDHCVCHCHSVTVLVWWVVASIQDSVHDDVQGNKSVSHTGICNDIIINSNDTQALHNR